jgi:thioredoxin reductase (NADPH)
MYDLIIIGAGPAGLGASIYASRYKLGHIVIGNEIGGQVVEASEIENWAGELSIPGKTLMEKFEHHAHNLGGKIIQADVNSIVKDGELFTVKAGPPRVDKRSPRVEAEAESYQAKAIILALGMKPRKMDVPGEREFVGKGVSYCATCDAMFFREKDVAVIGGGDAAATAAIHLTEFAKKVSILYRDQFTWEPLLDEELNKKSVDKIQMKLVKAIKGEGKVSGLVYEDENGEKELTVQGVFIEVGTIPGVVLAEQLGVKLDEQSYIIVDQTQATNVEFVYAAGDVTTGSNKFRQIITAVAEGAVASGSVYRKLKLGK